MTPAQHFVHEVCRVRAPCLHALLQRENNQNVQVCRVCRQAPPFSLEKRKREKREKRKEALPCLHTLHTLHKRHETTQATDRPYPNCASPAPSGPSYVHRGHVVGFTTLPKANRTHTDHPAAHYRHGHAATRPRTPRTGLAAHPAPRPRKTDHVVVAPE